MGLALIRVLMVNQLTHGPITMLMLKIQGYKNGLIIFQQVDFDITRNTSKMDLFSTKLLQLSRSQEVKQEQELIYSAIQSIYCYEQVFGPIHDAPSQTIYYDQKSAVKLLEQIRTVPHQLIYKLEVINESIHKEDEQLNMLELVLDYVAQKLNFDNFKKLNQFCCVELKKHLPLFDLQMKIQFSVNVNQVEKLDVPIPQLDQMHKIYGKYPLGYVGSMIKQLQKLINQKITSENLDAAAVIRLKQLTLNSQLVQEATWACQLLYNQLESKFGKFINLNRQCESKINDFKEIFSNLAWTQCKEMYSNQTQFAYLLNKNLQQSMTQYDVISQCCRLSKQQLIFLFTIDQFKILEEFTEKQMQMFAKTNSQHIKQLKKELQKTYPLTFEFLQKTVVDSSSLQKWLNKSQCYLRNLLSLDQILVVLLIKYELFLIKDEEIQKYLEFGELGQGFQSIKEQIFKGQIIKNELVQQFLVQQCGEEKIQFLTQHKFLLKEFLKFFSYSEYNNIIDQLVSSVSSLCYYMDQIKVHDFSLFQIFEFLIKQNIIGQNLPIKNQINLVICGEQEITGMDIIGEEHLTKEIQQLIIGLQEVDDDDIFQQHSLNLLLQFSEGHIAPNLMILLKDLQQNITIDENMKLGASQVE